MHSKEKPMKKIFSKYAKYIMIAADKFHSEGNHRPQIKDYCIEVSKYMECRNSDRPTAQQARYQISRMLKRMSEGLNNKLLCINGKYFVLNTETYFQEKLIEECYDYFKDKIKVNRKDIMRISYNMCALLVELKANNDVCTVGELFKDYLDDNCFEVLECENLLFILLKCDSENKEIATEESRENIIINVIESAISRIYEDQEREGRRALKRKRRQKNTMIQDI